MSHIVVGVLGADFRFVEPYDLCVCLRLDDDNGFLEVIGRLKPEVPPAKGAACLDTIYRRVSDPRENGAILLGSMHGHLVKGARPKV